VNARQEALFRYIGTLAADPRVRLSLIPPFSLDGLRGAVWDSLLEDLPVVMKEAAKNGLALVRPAAVRAAREAVGGKENSGLEKIVDGLFTLAGQAIAGPRRR
jgi:hypothetical protein